MRKNPGGNFGNDFFRKGDWGLPQKYKRTSSLRGGVFFIKFVKGYPFTMLAISKCYCF